MEDYIRDILKNDTKLLHAYEKSEAKYILDLKDDYVSVDVDLDINNDEFQNLTIALAKLNLCFDQWALNQINDFLIKEEMEKLNEKTSKHSKDMED